MDRTSRPNASYIGDWCCDNWCYVDQSCPTAVASTLVPGLYYSSTGCDAVNPPAANAVCPYSCGCASNTGFPFTDAKFSNRNFFPLSYGNTCNAWEKEHCAEMWPGADDPGGWCCEEWCYVDSKCPTAIPSWQNASAQPLYWSFLACGGEEAPVNATSSPAPAPAPALAANDDTCKWEPEVSCLCTGSNAGFPFDVPPLYSDMSLFPLTYGTSCSAWEMDKCNEMWPNSDNIGDWCCQVRRGPSFSFFCGGEGLRHAIP